MSNDAEGLAAAFEAGRLAALDEAAAVVYEIDAKKFRETYKADYNKKRYDIAGVEHAANRCLNIQAEDARDAILALKKHSKEQNDG